MFAMDHSRFPLVVTRMQGTLTAEDADAYERGMDAFFARAERFAVAVRVVETGVPEVRLLKRVANWRASRAEAFRAHVVCHSLLIPAAVWRGVSGFIDRIAPPPFPQRAFATWDETIAWAREQLAAGGIQIPEVGD